MEGRQKKLRDTIPARRPVLPSGVEAATPPPPPAVTSSGERAERVSGAARTHTDVAHDEMERAVALGLGALLADEVMEDGLRRQRSAQLMGDGRLVLSTWYRFRGGSWSQASTFTVEVTGVGVLRDLLECAPLD